VARTAESFAEGIAAMLASPPAPEVARALVEPYTWAANSARLHAHYRQLIETRAARAA
jgi:hypothetical protein